MHPPTSATELRTFDDIQPGDGDAVGGKGLSLARLASAGLPVPPGFCITTEAHRRLRGRAPDETLAGQIAAAYERLGGGRVAVRSSATAEDGAAASFAGQQETILGVEGASAVCAAVGRCWASLDGERAVAYRRHQGVGDEGLAMGVVVQRLVDAEAAGVLFTRDPLDAAGRRMLVEASWGLGESVVSGLVTPDRYHLERDTGRLCEQHVATKAVEVTAAGRRPVGEDRRDKPCLSEPQLAELAELGRRVEELYGEPRDVEWALSGGRFWLLQARPITAGGAAEREQVRREEMAAAAALAGPQGTVWARINLAESLPEPTPMTWALVRRYVSGKGGFGLMYRDLGFRPPAALDEIGVFDLVAGRVYCNLVREPQMSAGWLPKARPLAAFKAAPHLALDPPPATIDWSRVGPSFWLLLPLRLPLAVLRSARQVAALAGLGPAFAARFRGQVLPAFREEVRRAAADDLTSLDDAALRERLEHWVRLTLYDFARDALKPTVRAAIARENLVRFLRRKLGPERARAAVNELCMGVVPDPEADLGGATRDLMAGRLDRATFLERFGHRGEQEMELSRPRWREDPAALERLAIAPDEAHAAGQSPRERWEAIAAEAKLSKLERTALDSEVQILHASLALRETAKHYLMLGYQWIRGVLLEIDRRHRLHGGVFYLTPEELPRLAAGEDLSGLIAGRRRRRTVCLSLEAPPVLFSDDLEAIGRPPVVTGMNALQGVPLSAGTAEAPALVLEQPRTDALPAEPYILVCPSTDPAWVPLFVRARGLVMESGGVLSHGAIVAREYGLPAVAGLPGVHTALRSGQRLRVDGGRGTVAVLSE
jgi:phosphohistidine swiveling domain-containing protein